MNISGDLRTCSRGTFPRFSLQGSLLNICYCHLLRFGKERLTSVRDNARAGKILVSSTYCLKSFNLHLPRSAPKAVSLWLTPRAAQQPSRPPTLWQRQFRQRRSIRGPLQRHPFSGLVHSAGAARVKKDQT